MARLIAEAPVQVQKKCLNVQTLDKAHNQHLPLLSYPASMTKEFPRHFLEQ